MNDQFFMDRCLELAKLGAGMVSPNPLVGCVIVADNEIIGEGYHQEFGKAHAEVNAVNQVFERFGTDASKKLASSTVYVSLEPCAHFGKTPPCADLLIKHEVKRVVIANQDPFEAVSGKGIEKLKDAGIAVEVGLGRIEGYLLNRRFFTRILKKRPYIILKWAETKDGYFAPLEARQRWISGANANKINHIWRSEEDAILVGKNTALIDNPTLTNRSGKGKNPIRLLLDRRLEIPITHQALNNQAKTIIFNEIKTEVSGNIHYIQLEDMDFYLPQKLAFQLYLMDIQSVIIEGGRTTLDWFIQAKLWDEARIFVSQNVWSEGISAPQLNSIPSETRECGEDTLYIHFNKNND